VRLPYLFTGTEDISRTADTTNKREGGNEMSEVYDTNNNCVVCDQYIYDQHKTNCKHYVKETYLEFIKRIEKVAV
jgi:hypothetical protein